MMTIEESRPTPNLDRPWRRRFHRAATMALIVLIGAIALRWLWTRLQVYAPDLPDIRYVDGVALLLAIIAVAYVIRRVWRDGARSSSSA